TATTAGGGGGSDEGPIKLGFMIGVTGDYAPYYPPSEAGAVIAIEEINAAGGVLGRQVELVIGDNLSTAEGAVQAFNKLVDVDAVVAIGGTESDGAVANLQSIKDRKIPTLCPACGTDVLDDAGGDYIWRITGSDSDGGLIAAQFARDNGFTKVAMLVQNTEGAAGPAEVFKTVFTDKVGGEIVADIRFEPGQASYQTQVDEVFAAEPDAIYLAAGFEAGGIIFQEAARRGYEANWFVSPDLVVPEISGLEGVDLSNGIARAAIAAYDTASPAYESYAARYEERTGEAPSSGLYDANQYDQYIILALAMTAAGTTDGEAVAAKVAEILNGPGTVVYSYADGVAALAAGEDIDYHGASSGLDVNEFGNLASPVFGEQQIIDGEWTQVAEVALDESLRP
ncbi:MAG: ABC transporter substrate-binding protein, partial [Acidimicrobiia bacterium]|nr:ABC transporter substrate-binding protein [Acidimicrobiia bacterium]